MDSEYENSKGGTSNIPQIFEIYTRNISSLLEVSAME